ncbi:MAG: hypothetical protein ACPL1Y_06885, partial [Thermoplasmata archaeon]
KITNYKRMVICIGSCKSGQFLHHLKWYPTYTTEMDAAKRVVITSVYSFNDLAYYNYNREFSAFYYYFISALSGKGPDGTDQVNTDENTSVRITAEDNSDRDESCSVVEAYNWSRSYIFYYAWVPQSQKIGYNDMHNFSEYYQNIYPDFPSLPYTEASTYPPHASQTDIYIGLGSRGLGITVTTTYPINMVRVDT